MQPVGAHKSDAVMSVTQVHPASSAPMRLTQPDIA